MHVPKRLRSGTSVVSAVYRTRGTPFHRENALPAAVLGAKCASRRERRPLPSRNRDEVAKPRREPPISGRPQAKTNDWPATKSREPPISARPQLKTNDWPATKSRKPSILGRLRSKRAICRLRQAENRKFAGGPGQSRGVAARKRPKSGGRLRADADTRPYEDRHTTKQRLADEPRTCPSR